MPLLYRGLTTKESDRERYDWMMQRFGNAGLPTDELEYPEHAYGPW